MLKLINWVEAALDLAQSALLTVGFVAFSEEFESDANTAMKNAALGGLFIIQCVNYGIQKYKPVAGSETLLGEDAVGVQEMTKEIKPESRVERSLQVYYPVAKGLAIGNAFASGIVQNDKISKDMVYGAFASFALILGVKGVLVIKSGSRFTGLFILGAAASNIVAAAATASGHPYIAKNVLLGGGTCCLLLTVSSGNKLRQAHRELPAPSRSSVWTSS